MFDHAKVVMLTVLATLALTSAALAQANCPTVSDGQRILPVTITAAPQPVFFGSYDLNTNYLFITYQNQTNQMLVGVPQSLIVGHQTVPWTSISRYPSAVMQERSPCPLLQEDYAVSSGALLLARGGPLLLAGGGALLLQPGYASPGPPIWAQ